MSFSLSTFTVELNGKATIVFRAKWHTEAEDICRSWADLHRDAIIEQHRGGVPIPPVIKVRLASALEKAAYEGAAGDQLEFFEDLEIVRLSKAAGHSDEPDAGDATENQPEDAPERESADHEDELSGQRDIF